MDLFKDVPTFSSPLLSMDCLFNDSVNETDPTTLPVWIDTANCQDFDAHDGTP